MYVKTVFQIKINHENDDEKVKNETESYAFKIIRIGN